MIEAKELRVGNVVLAEGKEVVVTDITERGINITWYHELTCEDYEFSLLDGIPLTEEWLIKLGFVERIVRIDEYSTLRIADDGKFEILDTSDGQFVSSYDHRIEFIHQLQNLFHSLSGEELTIINL